MLLSYISGNGTWLGRVGALVKMSPYITEQQRPTLRCVFVSPVSAQRDAFSLWGQMSDLSSYPRCGVSSWCTKEASRPEEAPEDENSDPTEPENRWTARWDGSSWRDAHGRRVCRPGSSGLSTLRPLCGRLTQPLSSSATTMPHPHAHRSQHCPLSRTRSFSPCLTSPDHSGLQ